MDVDEVKEESAGERQEEEEVEYGFQPIGDLPETGSVPVIETDEEKPVKPVRACAADSVASCVCADKTAQPCEDDIEPRHPSSAVRVGIAEVEHSNVVLVHGPGVGTVVEVHRTSVN